MRDIAITAVILSLVPLIFWRPHVGILLWTWIGLMSPHRLTYGWAFSFPFAQIVAICTLIVLPFTKFRHRFPWGPIPVTLMLLMIWMTITSFYALNDPDTVFFNWSKAMKIHAMLLVTMVLIRGRKQIDQLIWVIVLSIGFYGVKGGVWTVLTGSRGIVWGPPRSYIEGNNELALALVMLIPLMYYLYQTATKRWIRWLLMFSMVSCGFSILGSHSRGAFLAVLAGAMFLALKSRRKALTGIVVAIGLAGMIAIMPGAYLDRMESIQNYEADSSSQARLYSWKTMWNLALDRPIVGGGFDTAAPIIYQRYAPDPTGPVYSSHSIYFQALSEHGFPGLFLFVLFGFLIWRHAKRLGAECAQRPGLEWVSTLMRMVQVSLLGFAVGGAFLGLLHYDLPYYLATLVVLAAATVKEEQTARAIVPPPPRAAAAQT